MADKRNIWIPTNKDGQMLQYTGQTTDDVTPDNIDTFDDGTGKILEEFGSKTKHTTIAKIRAMSGPNPNIQYLTHDYDCPGTWVVDSSDTTSADNTGTVLVTADGVRLKRKINGNVQAQWFGVSTGNDDNSDAINNGLLAAHTLGKDLELLTTGSFKIQAPIVTPLRTVLIMNRDTILLANSDTLKYMVRVRGSGGVRGGVINLSTYEDLVGIFIYGDDAAGTNAATSKIFTQDVVIRGGKVSGQVGIGAYIGVDSSMVAKDSSDGDVIVNVNLINTVIRDIDYGIDTGDKSTNGGTTGYINGINFDGYIIALKGIHIGDVPTSGNGHTFRGVIQTEPLSYISGATLHYAADLNCGLTDFQMMIWDWHPDYDRYYAITAIGRRNRISYAGNLNEIYVSVSGDETFTSSIRPYALIAPSSASFARFLGDEHNILLGADKKFTVSTSSTNYTNFKNIFYPAGTAVGYASFNDTDEGIYIDIQFGKTISYINAIGITFWSTTHLSDNIKFEYYHPSNGLTELITIADNINREVWWKVQYGVNLQATGIRITLTSSTIPYVCRVIMYGLDGIETFLPVSGGKIYGDVLLNNLKSKSYLGTDSDGKIIEADTPDTSFADAITAVTDDYTVLSTDHVITVTASTADIDITLPDPAAGNNKKIYLFAFTNPNGKSIRFGWSGGTLYNATGGVGALQVVSDGTTWWKLSQT